VELGFAPHASRHRHERLRPVGVLPLLQQSRRRDASLGRGRSTRPQHLHLGLAEGRQRLQNHRNEGAHSRYRQPVITSPNYSVQSTPLLLLNSIR
jgi:hypothetical protein